jgi:hypothetical protein
MSTIRANRMGRFESSTSVERIGARKFRHESESEET